MKPIYTMSALVTVIAAALIAVAPMASQAANFPTASSLEFSTESISEAPQCSLKKSSAQTGCSDARMESATSTADLMSTLQANYQHSFTQSDSTSVLLEDLIKTGSDRSVESL